MRLYPALLALAILPALAWPVEALGRDLKQRAAFQRANNALDLTNEQLAAAIGVKLPTLMAYLAPEGAAKHRKMPAGSRLLLERILADHRAVKRGRN